MKTLWQLGAEMEALAQLADEVSEGGEVPEELSYALDKWFAEINDDLESKVDGYAALIQDRLARAEARSKEAKRLQALATADENLATRLKDRLKTFLEFKGIRRIDSARYRVTVATNGGKQPLDIHEPAEKLPEEYTKIEVKPDSEKIRAALEAGKKLGFAVLQPRSTHLRIS